MTPAASARIITFLVLVAGLAGCAGMSQGRDAPADRFDGAAGIDVPAGPSEPSWWLDPIVESPPEPNAPAIIEATIPADALYEVGSADVTATAERALDTVHAALDGAAITHITLQCHADSIGTAASNQTLSEQRAANLAVWITQRWNVPAQLIEQRGYGDTQPVATNDTPTGRAQNRRCNIAITTRPQP